MDNQKDKIMWDSFFQPLRRFLIHTNTKPEHFLDMIAQRDPYVFKILSFLAEHGAYDMVVPVNALMDRIMEDSDWDWWESGMKRLPEADLLEQIGDNFRRSMRPAGRLIQARAPEKLYAFIWDAYPAALKETPQHGRDLCLLLPGLYASKLTEDYFQKLETRTLVQLQQAVEALDTQVICSDLEYALVKYVALRCGTQLGLMYHSFLWGMSNEVLRCSWHQFRNLRYWQYQQLLRSHTERFPRYSFYLTPAWVERMDVLCRHMDKFQIDDMCADWLRMALPILMQCVDRNGEASERLLTLLGGINIRECSDQILIQGIFRALSVETEAYQDRFYGHLSEIFSNTAHMATAAEVVSDIVKFYTRFSKEVQMRFDSDGLAMLLKSADADDQRFYQIYEDILRYGIDGICDEVKWVGEKLFAEGRIVPVFEKLLECIRNQSDQYSVRLQALNEAAQLFGLLAGGLRPGSGEQMYVYQCLDFLQLSELQAAARQECQAEIPDLYSFSQCRTLRDLKRRLHEVRARLPLSDSVLKYAHNTPQEKYAWMFNVVQKRIDNLQITQEATAQEIKIILSALSGDNPTRNRVVTALAEKREVALAFSDGIHELLKHTDSLPESHVSILENMRISVETAISDDEGLTKEKRKEYFDEVVDAFISLVPGLEQIVAAGRMIGAMKKIVEASADYTES